LSLASGLMSRRDNQDGWSVMGPVGLAALRDAADLLR